MSELIAEFAINDQISILNQNGNIEVNSKYILNQHKVTGTAFTESYSYYLSKPNTLRKIFNNAQEILEKKDPAAKEYIKKKNNPTGDVALPEKK